MEQKNLLRVFSLCTLIGGLLIALFQIWLYIDPISFVATYFDHVGWAFITIGLFGLYLFHSRQTGELGFFSFFLLSLAMFQWLGYKWFLTFVAPELRRSAPELLNAEPGSILYGIELSNYFLQASFLLFAVIVLLKGVLSKGASILLIIGSILAFAAQLKEIIPYHSFISQTLIASSFVWYGYSFLKQREKTAHPTEENEQKKREVSPSS